MPAFSSRPYMNYLRFVMAWVLGLAAISIVVMTYRWPLVWDAQVFHYINFLMDKGLAPYRDIGDMNMPGTYLVEGWAMHIFGSGDMAWRMYDFTLLGFLTMAMVVIARPYDWLAGLFSGVMFALVHSSEGPENSAQRDEAMTMFIMVGYALLFVALRRRKPWMMGVFGLSLGMASAMKPPAAPLAVVLLAMAWWTLRKRDEAAAPYIWGGIAGAAIAAATAFGFLFRYHAASAFFETSRRVIPYYAALSHLSFANMLRQSLPRVAFLMLPFGLVAAFVDREWKNWERWALLLGVAFGAFSYFGQNKGYAYHRYALVAFILLWMAMELALAMQKRGWVKAVGIAGMVLGVLIMVPTYVHRVLLIPPTNEYAPSLERDLTRLGGDRLQRKVQCLDVVDGCLNTLYHLKLVQSTNSLGDLLYFSPQPSRVVDYYRSQFWDQLNKNPPSVIVLSNEWFDRPSSFDKVNEWPQFASYLDENYNLAISREFPIEQQRAYRIYVRKGVILPRLGDGS